MVVQNITLKFASSEITLSAAMLLKALKCIYGAQTLSVFFIMCMDQQIVSSKTSNHDFPLYSKLINRGIHHPFPTFIILLL